MDHMSDLDLPLATRRATLPTGRARQFANQHSRAGGPAQPLPADLSAGTQCQETLEHRRCATICQHLVVGRNRADAKAARFYCGVSHSTLCGTVNNVLQSAFRKFRRRTDCGLSIFRLIRFRQSPLYSMLAFAQSFCDAFLPPKPSVLGI